MQRERSVKSPSELLDQLLAKPPYGPVGMYAITVAEPAGTTRTYPYVFMHYSFYMKRWIGGPDQFFSMEKFRFRSRSATTNNDILAARPLSEQDVLWDRTTYDLIGEGPEARARMRAQMLALIQSPCFLAARRFAPTPGMRFNALNISTNVRVRQLLFHTRIPASPRKCDELADEVWSHYKRLYAKRSSCRYAANTASLLSRRYDELTQKCHDPGRAVGRRRMREQFEEAGTQFEQYRAKKKRK